MPTKADTQTRIWLAIGVVGFSVLGITAFCVVALVSADDTDQMTERILTAVLPLFGTWVGTVLAFYFARDNFQAATESTLRLQGRSGELGTPVVDVMIKEKDIVALDLAAGQKPEDLALADLRQKMSDQKPPSRRLPIRDAAGAVLYVVHDSTLNAFADKTKAVQPQPTMFGELLADAEYKALVEAIGFVSEKATVADARKEMGSVKDCNDVFVTPTGKREERASGWLTNTLLAGIQ
jgi:hypothetical protein